ncbi:MAG TPA: peptide chain release factor N(5)-glutamine methyltransferase [Clostridia bacterium]|nr:peptide chain release factor N(5)-glutamine methyltransferase [Clostridia bacterium]
MGEIGKGGGEAGTVGEALKEGVRILGEAGVKEALRDAGLLLSEAASLPLYVILTERNLALPAGALARFRNAILRRAAGEPVQYITGKKEFMSLTFKIRPGVLVPRPETEILAEEAISILRERQPRVFTDGAGAEFTVVDVGTGSGAIGVSVAYYVPNVKVIATDLDHLALEVARENAVLHRVLERMTFLRGDLLDPVSSPVDMILANLPYIGEEEMNHLVREVRDFEPKTALLGGRTGVELIERLIDQAPSRLVQGGWLLLEVGRGQASRICSYVRGTNGLEVVRLLKDLTGIDRVLVIRKTGRGADVVE